MGQAKKKQRDCPAVGRPIGAAECGENRASRYPCPATCPHNPWSAANYDLALAIDDEAQALLFRRLREDLGAPLPQNEIERLAGMPDLGRQQHFIETFQLARDAQGWSFLDRWEAAGFADLKNDLRNFIRWKTNCRLRLLEIQEVHPGDECIAMDVFDPAAGRLVVHDRSLAASAVRFTQLLTWTFACPHYTRMLGIAVSVPEFSDLDPDDVVRLVVEHLGGPTAPAEMLAWLQKNLVRVEESFRAVNDAVRAQMLAAVDARFTKTSYRLRGTDADLLRRLDECPAVRPEPPAPPERDEGFSECRVWFDEASPAEPASPTLPLASAQPLVPGRTVLGRVLVAADRVRVEAMSAAQAAALRAQFEKRAGRLVEFVGERVDDLGARLRQHHPTADLKLVPPGLLEHAPWIVLASSRLDERPGERPLPDVERHMRRRLDELFLANPVPALNNLTPRQAAADPQWRPALIRLLKQRIRQQDRQNLEAGGDYEINWMIEKLGLTEILFPPPPWRKPADAWEDDEDDEFEEFAEKLDESLPPSPPLPDAPFTAEEVEKRAAAVVEVYPEPEQAVDAVSEIAPFLLELVVDAIPAECTPTERALAVTLATQLWFLFAPPGTRGWPVNSDQFVDRIEHLTVQLTRSFSPPAMEKVLTSDRQPAVARYVMDLIQQSVEEGPRKHRTDPMRGLMLMVLLIALAEELDEAARA